MRLNKTHKKTILKHLENNIEKYSFKKEDEAIVALEAKLEKLVIPLIDQTYPIGEMTTLLKYSFAGYTSEVVLNYPIEGMRMPIKLTKARLLPSQQRWAKVLPISTATISKLYKQINISRLKIKEKKCDLVKKYETVVNKATKFETLVELIPELSKMKNDLFPGNNLTSVIPPGTLNDIKKDSANRAKVSA